MNCLYTFPYTKIHSFQNISALNVFKQIFNVSLPKIPYSILLAIVQSFKDDASDNSTCKIYWNGRAYYIDKPLYGNKRYSCIDTNDILVMTIHSHNNNSAKFTVNDDLIDNEIGLYGVLDNIKNNFCFDYKFRARKNGAFSFPLKLSVIFLYDYREAA